MRIDHAGANQQGHGLPPGPHTHGEDLDLNISLNANASKVVCTVRGTANSGRASSPSSVEESVTAIREIAVRTSGGKGSPGIRGSDGARGQGGYDGLDATRHSPGTNGQDGGPGTDGSPGSSGGKGGDAGNVTIHVTESDVDLLALLSVESLGGQGGDPGAHGTGGPGGTPGRGGSPYSWQTSHQVAVRKQRWEDRVVYEPTNTTDIQMGGGSVKKSELVYYTDYETRYENHSQPGGRSGIPGQPGKTPSTPLYPGERGRDGSLTIHVRDGNGHSHSYRGPFDLALLSYTSKASLDNGIYEPGDTVEISNITLRNTGAMPTPDGSRIKIYLERDEWMVCEPQELYLLGSIPAGQSVTIEGTMKFTIKERPVPSTGIYGSSGTLDLGAGPSRFAAPFKKFTLERTIPIAHPIAVTDISSPGALLPGEVAQLTFKIKNASTKAIGAKAIEEALQRAMTLTIELERTGGRPSGITFCDANGSPRTSPVIDRSISSIQPGKISTISCHILLPHSSQNHATHRIKVGLQLQRLGASRTMKTIQVETIDVKEGIEYHPKTSDDLILVTNLSTTQDELNAWTQVASDLGLSFAIWDLSIHGHLDLTCTYPNDPKRSLHTDWTNKTVVLLNQPGALGNQSTLTPMEMLSSSDLDVALRLNNTRFYVVGRSYAESPRPRLRPANRPHTRETIDAPSTFISTFRSTPPKAGTEYTITISRYAHPLSSSPQDYFKEQAASITEHLQKRFPEYSFSIESRYNHRKEASYSFTGVSRETVGTVTVRCDETARDSIMIGTSDYHSNGHSRQFVTSPLNKAMLVAALPNMQLAKYAIRSLGRVKIPADVAGVVSAGILHKIILEAQTTLGRKDAKHFGGLPLLDTLTELCASEMTSVNTKDGIGWARCLADLSFYGSRSLPWSHVLLVFSARFRISELVENKVWAIEKKLRQVLPKESWAAYRAAKNQRLSELRTQYGSKTLEEIEAGLTHRTQVALGREPSTWAVDPYRNDSTVTEASHAHREHAMRQEVVALIQRRGKGK